MEPNLPSSHLLMLSLPSSGDDSLSILYSFYNLVLRKLDIFIIPIRSIILCLVSCNNNQITLTFKKNTLPETLELGFSKVPCVSTIAFHNTNQ